MITRHSFTLADNSERDTYAGPRSRSPHTGAAEAGKLEGHFSKSQGRVCAKREQRTNANDFI